MVPRKYLGQVLGEAFNCRCDDVKITDNVSCHVVCMYLQVRS